jgi:YesN/AraC family two-component response regulator
MFIADPNGHDLLLTDQAMPGITGIGLSENVLAVRPDMPIILCTGYTHESNLEKMRRLGISEILLKPVSTSILGSALRRALGCGKLDRI